MHISSSKSSKLQNKSEKPVGFGREFDKLIDESFDSQLYNADKVQDGALVTGRVLSVTDEDVFLDVGVKMQGMIPLSEFSADEVPEEGVELQAVVIKRNAGNVLLSYARAKEHRAMESLRHAFKNSIPVRGFVKGAVPGGFTVIISDIFSAFVPISQIDTKHVEDSDMSHYIGNSYDFLIQFMNKNKQFNLVLSRRRLLTSQVHRARETFFSEKKIGDTVKGTVKNYTAFGLFIDLGGFDGLLHVSDISWSRHVKPSSIASPGDVLELKIIKIDPETKKINLSLKELASDPWDTAHERYQEGMTVRGEVVKMLPYGVFVRLEEAIEGFVHISELSWLKRVSHPSEVVSLSSFVECKVLSVDKEMKRISLGVKQVHKNPWDNIETMYPPGLKVRVIVKKTIRTGAVVEFEEGPIGFIPLSEYSWNKKIRPKLHVGEKIDAKIIGHDMSRHELKLSIRKLTENPWETLSITAGTVREGIITAVTDFGIFVKMSENIEGLVPKSHCYDPHEHSSFEEIRSKFVVGDTIQVYIKEINQKTEKLLLSVRNVKSISSRKEMEKHMMGNDDNPHVYSLGDMINKPE